MADTVNGANGKGLTMPYAPFKSFLSTIEMLEHGLPNQIDRSVFSSMSGVLQSQILGTFRFLGLIAADGKPTPDLHKLVEEKDSRKQTLHRIVQRSYPKLIELGLDKASPASLDAELRNSSLAGETLVKAKTFFLQAAKYAEIKLSPYLLKVTRVSAPRKKRNGKPVKANAVVPEMLAAPVAGPTKQITLENGVTLVLAASHDMFSMAPEDRTFVLGLLTQLEKYEEEHPPEEEIASEEEDETEEVHA